MFRTVLSLVLLLVVACGSDEPEAGEQCAKAKGTCEIGGGCSVFAPDTAQDCNPQLNPGGSQCCLEVPPR